MKGFTVAFQVDALDTIELEYYPHAASARDAAIAARKDDENAIVAAVFAGHGIDIPDLDTINDKLVCCANDCNELYDDGGDGFDGLCPECADKADARGDFD